MKKILILLTTLVLIATCGIVLNVYIGKSAIRETPNERSNSRFITQEFGAGYNFTLCQVNTEIPEGEEVTAEKIAFIKEYTREIIASILN